MEQRKTRPTSELQPSSGGDPLGDAFGAASAPAGSVYVTHGPYAEMLPVDGRSVGEIRRRFADRLDIHPQAVAFVGGQQADEDTVVSTDQVLMFVRPAGEKGSRSWRCR